jgi:formate hydrogenlyase subunit 3/multisubunit Na+/H+ antiporter MnhD subunit
MDTGLLETLVKLASLGASGVCIFAIFWVGWLILQLPSDASTERHKSLRFFIVACVIIAVISGVTGLVNAKFNVDEITELSSEITNLTNKFDEYKAEKEEAIDKYKAEQIKNQEVAHSLSVLLGEKEIAALESGADRTVQASIRMLKNSISRLRGSN